MARFLRLILASRHAITPSSTRSVLSHLRRSYVPAMSTNTILSAQSFRSSAKRLYDPEEGCRKGLSCSSGCGCENCVEARLDDNETTDECPTCWECGEHPAKYVFEEDDMQDGFCTVRCASCLPKDLKPWLLEEVKQLRMDRNWATVEETPTKDLITTEVAAEMWSAATGAQKLLHWLEKSHYLPAASLRDRLKFVKIDNRWMCSKQKAEALDFKLWYEWQRSVRRYQITNLETDFDYWCENGVRLEEEFG